MMFLDFTTKEKTIEILKIKLDFLTRDLKNTSDLINHIQNDSKADVQQYDFGNESLAKKIKNTKINTTEIEKRKTSITAEIETLEKAIKKITRNNHMIVSAYVFPVVVMSIFLLYFALGGILDNQLIQEGQIRSNYLIQNLRGDIIDTWISWRLVDGATINVNLIDGEKYPDKADIVRTVLLSEESIEIDNSLLHKGLKGTTSTYYIGWAGALGSIKNPTKFHIPQKFNLIDSANGEGDITIRLSTQRNGDGYSGYTKSIADDSQNQILKSEITIYDVSNLSKTQFETILRHEIGHAFGLAHSTAPEDLMFPTIETNYPYISECDIDAIKALYNGEQTSQVLCQK